VPLNSSPPLSGNPLGISAYAGGLIIGTVSTGVLFYHDLDAGNTIAITSVEESFPGSDGILVSGDKVYSTNNQLNKIHVYDLEFDNEGIVTIVKATLAGTIESALYDSPSTTTFYDGKLYSVNARFDSVPFPADGEGDLSAFTEEFSIVGVSIDDRTGLETEE